MKYFQMGLDSHSKFLRNSEVWKNWKKCDFTSNCQRFGK